MLAKLSIAQDLQNSGIGMLSCRIEIHSNVSEEYYQARNVLSTNKNMTCEIHSSKKVTQHDFDRLYFCFSGFLCMKLDIPRKLVYMPSLDAHFVRIVSLGRVQGE